MGKRKGRRQDSAFMAMTEADFLDLYERRSELDPTMRKRVERHAKAIGLRNRRKDRR